MSNSEAPTIVVTEIGSMPDACLVRFHGSLDEASSTAVHENLFRLINENKKYVIADLHNVSMVSSAAYGGFLTAKLRLAEKGGDLVLSSLKLDLKMKMVLLGANQIFRIYADLRSAMNAYAWEIKHEPQEVRLAFPTNLAFVPSVRGFVSQVMRLKGYSDRDSFRIETIVDEICNNAIEYGANDRKNGIVLRITINWDRVEIDAENASDPEKIDHFMTHMKQLQETAKIDPTEKRGRGLSLVKMLASELTADVTPKGTTVHVTKIKEG